MILEVIKVRIKVEDVERLDHLLTLLIVLFQDSNTNPLWKRYRHIEVRYTKGGIDENELARYNATQLCGLDNILPNSYANALLQVDFVCYRETKKLNSFSYPRFCTTFQLCVVNF